MAPTITIKKSLVGLVVIFAAGFVLAALLFLGAYASRDEPQLAMIMAVVGLFTILVTFIQAIVYRRSFIRLEPDGLYVEKWSSLFGSVSSTTEWSLVQDVTTKKGSALAYIFGYGTLLVQTAGAEPNLVLTQLPNIDALRDAVELRAKAA